MLRIAVSYTRASDLQLLYIYTHLHCNHSPCSDTPPPTDTANREENYQKKSADFEAHSKKMAATAAALAKSGVITDRKLADALISTSRKVRGVVWGVSSLWGQYVC